MINKRIKGWTNSGSFKKGMIPWNKGIPMKKESKIKESLSKKNKPAKFINMSKEDKFSKILFNKISKPERTLIYWIKKEKLPINYTGDGKLWIKGDIGKYGNNEIFNPDFITYNNKTIIEIDSRWRKTIPKNIKRTKRRNNTYKKKGYNLIILDEKDVKKGKKSLILNKLKEVKLWH